MIFRFACIALFAGSMVLHPAVSSSPVLVELFTSEGCSDCPPADALLGKLDSPQVIVLSEHVDYWNRTGWTDPFSSAQFSQRQNEYAARFRIDSIYTPQMVVDGSAQFVGSDSSRAREAIAAAAKQPKTEVSVSVMGSKTNVRVGEHNGAVLVYLAVAQDKATSNVRAGENRGRELHHVAVVRSLTQIASLKPGQTFEQDIEIPRKALQPGVGMHAVVFIQDKETGRILGSAVSTI